MTTETFLDNFAHLLDAPNGIAKLKELILQLAVQGKLVAQDPSDEPASVLLERIGNEKQRLIKEKIISKNIGTCHVSKDEEPYSIPINWHWSRLTNLGIINPRNDFDDEVESAFIPMTLIPEEYGHEIKQEIRKWGEIKKGYTHFAENDVAVAKITPCFQNGKSAVMRNLLNGVGAGTTELHVFRPITSDVLPDYVLVYFKSPKFIFDALPLMTGTAGQQRVPKEYINENPFPLPPLEEQKRIVKKVDELMALVDGLQHTQQQKALVRSALSKSSFSALANTSNANEFADNWQRVSRHFDELVKTPEDVKTLRQTVLQLAVQGRLTEQREEDGDAREELEIMRLEKARLIREKVIRNSQSEQREIERDLPNLLPKGWVYAFVDDIADIGTGSTPLKTNPSYYVDGNIPWITSSATSKEYIYETETFITEKAVKEARLRLYPPETLLIALYGQGKTRGQIAHLKIPATINQALAAIVFLPNFDEVRNYVLLVFKEMYEEIRSLAAGGAQPNLNVGKIKETLIPLPPLAEQKRIVAKVDSLMSICDRLEAALQQQENTAEKLVSAAVQGLAA